MGFGAGFARRVRHGTGLRLGRRGLRVGGLGRLVRCRGLGITSLRFAGLGFFVRRRGLGVAWLGLPVGGRRLCVLGFGFSVRRWLRINDRGLLTPRLEARLELRAVVFPPDLVELEDFVDRSGGVGR